MLIRRRREYLECASLPEALGRWDPRSCDPLSCCDRHSSVLSFSRRRQRSRDDTAIGRSWCTARWRCWPRKGIFRHESAGSMVSGPFSCGGALCARQEALTTRHFLTGRALEVQWHYQDHVKVLPPEHRLDSIRSRQLHT